MDLQIRRGQTIDVGALMPLWTSMVEHHRAVVGHEWPVRDAADAWAIRRHEYLAWLADGTGTLFMATLATAPEPVGYAMLRVHPGGATWDLGAQIGELESLAVVPESRAAGVGTALVAACRDELKRQNIDYWSVNVVEANVDAVRLYERAGFQPYYRLMLGRVD
jgi:ribosomal protein S18 acetylase RimI-like enzyme